MDKEDRGGCEQRWGELRVIISMATSFYQNIVINTEEAFQFRSAKVSAGIYSIQGSHTSQMTKFKGISRVIKGSTTPFQGYFWKTVVTLLYVNKISNNFSHLFQDFFGSTCSILRRY